MPCERVRLVIPQSGTAGSNPPLNSANPRVHDWNGEIFKVRRVPLSFSHESAVSPLAESCKAIRIWRQALLFGGIMVV
jgi:hypothetical protein